MTSSGKSVPGPIEARQWAERLPAHVASPGADSRVRGYRPVADLAAHYSFGEYIAITLGAEAPSPAWGRALDAALIALGQCSVADAAVHAGTLSARFKAPPRASLVVGMIGLAEQADAELGCPPETGSSSAALWGAIPEEVRCELDTPPATQFQLAMTILRAVGLCSEAQLLATLCLCRLPILAAEIDAVVPGDLRGYPMRLPDFVYVEDGE